MEILKRLEDEYENWKREKLNQTQEKIYNSFQEIYFYENMIEFLLNSDEEILNLLENLTLKELFKHFLNEDNVNWCDEDSVEQFLRYAVL